MEKNKVKKFKAFVNPRYLYGQAPAHVLISDLKEYNNHRYKVFTVHPRVDDKPLKMNPTYYINSQRLINDALRLQEIDKQNKDLVKKINTINQMGGRVDTFNPIAYQRFSKWRSYELKQLAIAAANKKFIKRSQKRCFMDFRVRDGVYLGRIVIELYRDVVPVTVQNFLAICCQENGLTYKNCPIHNIVPKQYFETGDIVKGNGKGGTSIYGYTFAEENHKLKHTKAGVLSAIRVGKKLNNSQFSITLAPVEKLDGNRVVFGKVIKGHETLCKINDLGLKLGRPAVPILIHDCGIFIKGETAIVLKKFKF